MKAVENFPGQNKLYGKQFTALILCRLQDLNNRVEKITSTVILKDLVENVVPEIPDYDKKLLKKRLQRTLEQLSTSNIIDRKEHFNEKKIKHYSYNYVW